jgi:hypothetical protein
MEELDMDAYLLVGEVEISTIKIKKDLRGLGKNLLHITLVV